MNHDRLWVLIARKFSGEASADDLIELADLEKQYPQVREYVTIISVWWNLTEELGKDKAAEIFEKLLSRIDSRILNPELNTSGEVGH